MNIVITAGHDGSLHSIALMHNLQENNHKVIGCIQVKTFQVKRLRYYLKQYGWKTVKAKFMSHVLGKENTFLANETKPIKSYLERLNITKRKTTSFCKKNGIKHIKVNSINDKKFEKFLNKNNVDLIIYAGGGIVRKNIINNSKYGVLNAHSGWLPFFRGMNVIEWSILYGFRPYTSIHLIDPGIDTGKILYQEPIPLDKNLYTVRGNATVHNVELLTKITNHLHFYIQHARSQKKQEGKQFFVMHPALKQVVSDYLNRNYEEINSVLADKEINELNFE
ncbi:MAG: formyltransferase family protein [Candidatus Woesearchaeota archaeon]